jgi:nitroreductase
LSNAFPDAVTLRTVLELASRAPSAQNSQPWRWQVDGDGLHLDADWSRRLGDAHSDRRDVVLSCGAVLNHCAVALAAAGWQARIRRLPDGDTGHLASFELIDRAPSDAAVELADAIPRRRSDRRRYGHERLPAASLELLLVRAARFGVTMNVVPKLRWARLPDGRIRLRYGPGADGDDEPSAGDGVLLVLATDTEDDDSRLLAGEAMSHLMLSATALGFSSCPFTEPFRDERDRLALACEVYDGGAYPQVMVRLGPSLRGATELAPQVRRSVAETTTWL